jgi:hypothetical protein
MRTYMRTVLLVGASLKHVTAQADTEPSNRRQPAALVGGVTAVRVFHDNHLSPGLGVHPREWHHPQALVVWPRPWAKTTHVPTTTNDCTDLDDETARLLRRLRCRVVVR